MAAWRFEAVDRRGQPRHGVVEADSPRAARGWIRGQGWLPVTVAPVAEAGPARRGRPLPAARLALLTRQFATLLEAGMAMEPSLSALVDQAEDARARGLLAELRSDVLGGMPLARAMERQGKVFPVVYRTLVAAGEQSGQLASVLARLADYLETRDALRQKVLQASIYPAILFVVSIGIVFVLMDFVVPKVVKVFHNSHQALPLLTRALIEVSGLLQTLWPALLAAAVAVAFLFRRALRNDAFRARLQGRLMRLPLFGRLLVGINAERLAATLAILTGAGVPLLDALKAAGGVMTLAPMRAAMDDVQQMVREGTSLSRAMGRQRVFPAMMVHLVASGENSGRLEQMLQRAAEQQARDLQNRVATLSSLLEPVLILVMGGLVLLIVVAVMAPILNMNDLAVR